MAWRAHIDDKLVLEPAKLGVVVNDAFEADARHAAEDAAKKRAILTARSYDEFRHIVAAAGQKPLARDDTERRAATTMNRAMGVGGGTGADARAAEGAGSAGLATVTVADADDEGGASTTTIRGGRASALTSLQQLGIPLPFDEREEEGTGSAAAGGRGAGADGATPGAERGGGGGWDA
jgi:hypothetical protein